MKLGTFVRPNDLSRLDEAFAPLREMGFTSCQLAYKPEVFRPEDADLIRRAEQASAQTRPTQRWALRTHRSTGGYRSRYGQERAE